MQNVPEHLYTIRGFMGCCHFLADGECSVMIDTGMVGERGQIRRVMRRLGLRPQSLSAILLTHGHIDHTGNLAWLKGWSGATVYAHPAETQHVAGDYPYSGAARWCGRLEALARWAFRYRAATIDVHLADGDELPLWGGLRVVHLPGHTLGHCGFYSARHNLLFSGDMFASYFFNVHRPPAILNSAPELLAGSYEKMRALGAQLLVPSHYDVLDGALHRRRFERLMGMPQLTRPG